MNSIVFIDLIALVAVIMGLSLFTGMFSHATLSLRGNSYAGELSYIIILLSYIGIECVLGIFSPLLTSPMLIVVLLLFIREIVQPVNNPGLNHPIRIREADSTILCFQKGKEKLALSAYTISSIPVSYDDYEEKKLLDEVATWFYPFWDDGQKSNTVFTFDIKIDKGLVSITVFIVSRGKDYDKVCDDILRSQELVETWFTRYSYGYELLSSDITETLYLDQSILFELEFNESLRAEQSSHGFLTIQGVPTNASTDISQLVNKLLTTGVSGRMSVTFKSDKTPRLRNAKSEFQTDPEQQSAIPYKIQEHLQRDFYKQIDDIELCEHTGTFQVNSYLLLEGFSTDPIEKDMKRVKAAIHSVWCGVHVSIVPLHKLKRDWSSIALRNYAQKSTQISGARLSELLQISEGIPGTPNRIKIPEFSIPLQTPPDVKSILFGTVLHKGRPTSQQSRIAINHLPTHVGIWGTTGSGKTNTAFQLAHQTYQQNIPFLVIDLSRKKEWRRLGSGIPEVRIFTARDFRYNFLDVPIGVSVSAHINSVSTAWIAAWPTEGILKQHVEKVFRQAYKNGGWNLYTGARGNTILVTDLYAAMLEVTHGLLYSDKLKQDFIGALTARFQTLVEDPILSVMFNTTQGLSIPDLLNNYTILEFNGMSDEQKALVTSLIMVSVTDYLEVQTTPYNQQLNHLLVLEEAHHVLKKVDISSEHAAQQHAIDSLIQLLREARGLGLGVILLDQLPRHLAEAAVELPATTIIHALFSEKDRLMVGGNGNLTDEQFRHIANMKVGEIVLIQGFTGQSVNVQVDKFIVDPDSTAPPWTDKRVREFMFPFYETHPHLKIVNIPKIDHWQLDSTVLWTLKIVTETPEFIKTYQGQLETGIEFAFGYVRGMISDFLIKKGQNPESYHIEHYTKLLLEHITNRTDPSPLFTPIDSETTKEGVSVD